ncbi:MAG TPA: HD domain-containing protein, partial [Candidatus Baltobacteraceae bacterium]|nr:HD domain-containing protein [Candidatus Baltobacteraceae bacterium]
YINYAPLFQKIERPGILYLALLLHDVGKAEEHKKGGHAEASADMSLRAAKRLKLDSTAMNTLQLLIEHHLLMAVISQRRDLDDVSVIKNFAQQIETPENLNLLTLLTFSDAQGTSDKLWNGFKDSLLWQLHSRAMPLLTGSTEFVRASEKQRELLAGEVRELAPKKISDEEIATHFASLQPRYFEIHTAKEIIDDIELAHRFMEQLIHEGENALSPIIAWSDEPDRGHSVVKICTWDRAGLFSEIAGCLSASGLNILSAQIFTRSDGIALDEFFVTDSRTGNLATKDEHEKFDALMEKVLTGMEVDLSALIKKQIAAQPQYQPYAGERMPTQIRFDNTTSETRSVIEI